jgi:hypothetical protein
MWGIVALGIWAVAVLGANLSALVPTSVYGALHASRLDGSTMNQLRSDVATLEEEAARMKRENNQLLQRFAINEEAAGAMTRRVGALEISIPKLVEQQFASFEAVDSMPTGSIGAKPLTFEVDGGTVTVQQRPMELGSSEVKLTPIPIDEPVVESAVADGSSVGVALGFPVMPDEAEAQWQELLAKVGTMLIGLSPVLGEAEGSNGKLLVAGPVIDKASAIELCSRLDQQGVPCEPVPFAGAPVPMLN